MKDLKLVPQESVLFQCIGGSHAYGLTSAESDVDHRGVFIAEKNDFLKGDYPEDVSNETNDDVLFEVGKFIRLLAKSNPSVIELIAMPEDCVQGSQQWINSIDHSKVLSKQCKDTFAGYALSQIRKARKIKGIINIPEHEQEKTVLDFIDVFDDAEVQNFVQWRKDRAIEIGFRRVEGYLQLVEVRQYNALLDDRGDLLFNQDEPLKFLAWANVRDHEWKAYQKSFKAYWTWKKLQDQGLHGDYNSKNVMHAFRLVYMGIELARTGKLNVRRESDRKFLLEIRQNKYAYDELVRKLEAAITELNRAFFESSLPDFPDMDYLNEVLCATRKRCYSFE